MSVPDGTHQFNLAPFVQFEGLRTRVRQLGPAERPLDVAIPTDPIAFTDGGFSDVFEGSLIINGGEKIAVAVKRMRHATAMDEKEKEQRISNVEKEIAILAQLVHPNILPYLGVCNYGIPPPCLVTPWVPYHSLLQFLRARADADIRKLLIDVASALAYLHGFVEAHIVHGDVHERNVLVGTSPTGYTAILCDFGLSKVVPDGHPASNSNQGVNGRQGALLAPELHQMPDKDDDPAKDDVTLLADPPRREKPTDVWSFGMLAYTAYNNGGPWMKQSALTVVCRLCKNMRPKRPEHPQLQDDMWRVIESCWAHEPANRPTIDKVLRDLRPAPAADA